VRPLRLREASRSRAEESLDKTRAIVDDHDKALGSINGWLDTPFIGSKRAFSIAPTTILPKIAQFESLGEAFCVAGFILLNVHCTRLRHTSRLDRKDAGFAGKIPE